MKNGTKAAGSTFIRGLIGWAMYAGFIVCIIKWPVRAVALGCFMIATNIHSAGLKPGR